MDVQFAGLNHLDHDLDDAVTTNDNVDAGLFERLLRRWRHLLAVRSFPGVRAWIIVKANEAGLVELEFNYPTVISPLTNTPIAESGVTRWYNSSAKKDGDVLGNGLIR